MNLLLAAWEVTDVFSDVIAGDRQDQRVLRGVQEMDQDSQELVVLLIQTLSVLAPELGGLVHGRPFQTAGLDLGSVFVEGREVLDGALELFGQELDISGDVFVVEAALLEDGQLLQDFALHHCDAVFLGHLSVLWLLDQVAQHGEDDTRYLLLGAVAEDVSQDGDDVEFIHLLGQQWVECQHPQAENELVLDLKRK